MRRMRAFAELVRLPNVFTALADISLGGLAVITHEPASARGWAFGLLLAASACLYCAGMVWNDFFDVEQDRRERPFRPIPSGRISRRTAGLLATLLLVLGLGCALLSGWSADGFRWTPAIVAAVLATAILLYDGWLKRTWAGPLAMGSCRSLNVLLGLSLGTSLGGAWGWHLALIVGTYIVGVTWFARTEARASSVPMLTGAAVVMLVGLLLALPLPTWFPSATSSPLFPYLLTGLGLSVGFPVSRAIARPDPGNVQKAVKRAILGLVVLDAVLAMALVGTVGGVIVVLLLPAMLLGRWIYST